MFNVEMTIDTTDIDLVLSSIISLDVETENVVNNKILFSVSDSDFIPEITEKLSEYQAELNNRCPSPFGSFELSKDETDDLFIVEFILTPNMGITSFEII